LQPGGASPPGSNDARFISAAGRRPQRHPDTSPRRRGFVDLFARSPDGDLLYMTVRGDTWGTFERLGAPATTRGGVAVPLGLVTAPAACSSGPDRIDVLAVGQTGELLHTVWDGSGWSGFESLGVPALQCGDTQRSVPLSGPLAACAGGDHRIAVFV